MKTVWQRLGLLAAALLLVTTACSQEAAAPAAASDTASAGPLTPLSGMEAQAPMLGTATNVRLRTDAGDIEIALYAEAAPNAVKRFVELINSGFYNNTPISRVVPGFVAQFGVNWRAPHKDWEQKPFNDDQSLFMLERGTLAFAKAGPNSNSTQVFINYDDNSHLAARPYNFTTFGKITKGMEVVDKFVEVGEPGMGLDQDRLWADGEAYLKELAVKPTMIVKAEVLK
jgi:peptidyl-prolyl cis-trans isomerase A (cyclophilin A)